MMARKWYKHSCHQRKLAYNGSGCSPDHVIRSFSAHYEEEYLYSFATAITIHVNTHEHVDPQQNNGDRTKVVKSFVHGFDNVSTEVRQCSVQFIGPESAVRAPGTPVHAPVIRGRLFVCATDDHLPCGPSSPLLHASLSFIMREQI